MSRNTMTIVTGIFDAPTGELRNGTQCIVSANPESSSDFDGHENCFAVYTGKLWYFYQPTENDLAITLDNFVRWTGAKWENVPELDGDDVYETRTINRNEAKAKSLELEYSIDINGDILAAVGGRFCSVATFDEEHYADFVLDGNTLTWMQDLKHGDRVHIIYKRYAEGADV